VKTNGYCLLCSKEHGKEKSKKIFLEKYGVENPLQNEQVKTKIKQTNLQKYGVEYASQSNDAKEKRRNTNLEKYGVDLLSLVENNGKLISEPLSFIYYLIHSQEKEIEVKKPKDAFFIDVGNSMVRN
jgi:CRISPR/Cas system-associated protein Cas5 (RAMP superfamily)